MKLCSGRRQRLQRHAKPSGDLREALLVSRGGSVARCRTQNLKGHRRGSSGGRLSFLSMGVALAGGGRRGSSGRRARPWIRYGDQGYLM